MIRSVTKQELACKLLELAVLAKLSDCETVGYELEELASIVAWEAFNLEGTQQRPDGKEQ